MVAQVVIVLQALMCSGSINNVIGLHKSQFFLHILTQLQHENEPLLFVPCITYFMLVLCTRKKKKTN